MGLKECCRCCRAADDSDNGDGHDMNMMVMIDWSLSCLYLLSALLLSICCSTVTFIFKCFAVIEYHSFKVMILQIFL